jgi:putative transposase
VAESFTERLIGSIRRECLNHILVLGERHLRRTLTRYLAYYHGARTHLSPGKDAPDSRPIERLELGRIIAIREVGGLYITTSDGRPEAASPFAMPGRVPLSG